MSNHRTAQAPRTGTATTRKVMVSLGVVGAAAAVAGMGTFGTFTSTTSGSEQVSTGTVAIALGGSGLANNLSVAATGVVAGDTIQRKVDLTNTGTADLSSVTLTTAAAAGSSSVLDTDPTNGLQLKIDSCPTGWSQPTSTGAATCSGTTTPVLASRPVVGASMPLSTTRALPAAGTDNLLVTLTLPTSADNSFQGKSSTVGFTFTGTQRGATNR